MPPGVRIRRKDRLHNKGRERKEDAGYRSAAQRRDERQDGNQAVE